MMNCQFPAFCYHYLLGKGIDETFVRHLLKESCCPTLVSQIEKCTWDEENKSIITAAQAEEDARLQELENAAWYKDEFGKQMVTNMKQLKHSYTAAESLYKLDGERSVKTLHARNDPKEPQAQKKRREEHITVNSSSDSEGSGLSSSNMSTSSNDDTAMDSASTNDQETSMDEAAADKGDRTQRVRFFPTSSADASAPLPSAGGG